MNKTAWVDFDGTIVDAMPRYYAVLMDYLTNMHRGTKAECLTYAYFNACKRKGIKEHEIVKNACGIAIEIDDYLFFKKANIEDKTYLKIDQFIGHPNEAFDLLKMCGYRVIILTQRTSKENFYWELEKLFNVQKINFYNQAICVEPQYEKNAKYSFLCNKTTEDDIVIGDGKLEMQAAQKLGLEYYMVDSGFNCWKGYLKNYYSNYNKVAEHIGWIKGELNGV